MKTTIQSILTAAALFSLASCASTPSTQGPSAMSSATINVGGMSAAYKGAVATGEGTVNYQGRTHHFTMNGVGAGGYGAQKVAASGEVQNLHNLADFEGTYRGSSKGITLVNGTMTAKMTNEHGVIVYLSGERQGLATSSGVRVFKVKLTD